MKLSTNALPGIVGKWSAVITPIGLAAWWACSLQAKVGTLSDNVDEIWKTKPAVTQQTADDAKANELELRSEFAKFSGETNRDIKDIRGDVGVVRGILEGNRINHN